MDSLRCGVEVRRDLHVVVVRDPARLDIEPEQIADRKARPDADPFFEQICGSALLTIQQHDDVVRPEPLGDGALDRLPFCVGSRDQIVDKEKASRTPLLGHNESADPARTAFLNLLEVEERHRFTDKRSVERSGEGLSRPGNASDGIITSVSLKKAMLCFLAKYQAVGMAVITPPSTTRPAIPIVPSD